MMTKTHFEAIARIIKVEQEQPMYEDLPMCREAIHDVAIRLAAQFNIENPRFNREQFLTACGFKR